MMESDEVQTLPKMMIWHHRTVGVNYHDVTVFENHRKSIILQYYERSELRLHFVQKFIKNAKNGQFGGVLKNWGFWSNSVTRQVNFICWKMSKLKNSNETFWVIFKQYDSIDFHPGLLWYLNFRAKTQGQLFCDDLILEPSNVNCSSWAR